MYDDINVVALMPEPPMPMPPPGRREKSRQRMKKAERKKIEFHVEKTDEGGPKTSAVYEEKQKKQLIEDLWVWLHEPDLAEISITKKRN